MGQYYNPSNLDRKQWLLSHDYEKECGGFCGLKLMEHSWLKNAFVSAVERLLTPNNPWHKTRVVWAGDYSEIKHLLPQRVRDAYAKWYGKHNPTYAKQYSEDLQPNIYSLGMEEMEHVENQKLVKAPRWAFKKIHPAPLTKEEMKKFRYLVNHTKKQFVDKTKVPSDKEGWRVHPLPLLVCDSFGGGGSYHGDNPYAGTWVGDVISVEETKPVGFEEIRPDFFDE